MTFTDPNSVHNPATGTAAPAAWGDLVRDDLMALYGPPRCRVHRGSTQAILNNTLTPVLFDVEDIDTHTMHSTSSLTNRLTIPSGWSGDYMVGATVQWALSTGGTRRHAEIQINGAIKVVDADIPATASGYATQNLSALWFPVAGDYFDLQVFQDSGGNLNVQNDGYAGTIFWAYFVGSGAG